MQRILVCTALLAGSLFAAEPGTRILIAYHSQTGNTARMAKALSEGAAGVAGVEVILKKTSEVTAGDMKGANGILLGSPVHMHSLSIESMQFLARLTTGLGKDMGEGRTAGVFCTGGAESLGKEMARLEAIAAFLELRFVVIGGLEAEVWGNLGPEATTGDANHPVLTEKALATARRSGERFARLTRQFQAK
jgi:NAD(P)H dehydrogenase (quinone)